MHGAMAIEQVCRALRSGDASRRPTYALSLISSFLIPSLVLLCDLPGHVLGIPFVFLDIDARLRRSDAGLVGRGRLLRWNGSLAHVA